MCAWKEAIETMRQKSQMAAQGLGTGQLIFSAHLSVNFPVFISVGSYDYDSYQDYRVCWRYIRAKLRVRVKYQIGLRYGQFQNRQKKKKIGFSFRLIFIQG